MYVLSSLSVEIYLTILTHSGIQTPLSSHFTPSHSTPFLSSYIPLPLQSISSCKTPSHSILPPPSYSISLCSIPSHTPCFIPSHSIPFLQSLPLHSILSHVSPPSIPLPSHSIPFPFHSLPAQLEQHGMEYVNIV